MQARWKAGYGIPIVMVVFARLLTLKPRVDPRALRVGDELRLAP